MYIRTEHTVAEKGRILMGRLMPGTDLVPGILAMCTEAGIRFGYVASLIGSLSTIRFVYAQKSPSKHTGFVFSNPIVKTGVFEILSAQGSLGEGEDCKPYLHLHALLCDENDEIFGGHILEEGSIVLATIEVAIQETQGIRLIRMPDREAGASLFRVFKGY